MISLKQINGHLRTCVWSAQLVSLRDSIKEISKGLWNRTILILNIGWIYNIWIYKHFANEVIICFYITSSTIRTRFIQEISTFTRFAMRPKKAFCTRGITNFAVGEIYLLVLRELCDTIFSYRALAYTLSIFYKPILARNDLNWCGEIEILSSWDIKVTRFPIWVAIALLHRKILALTANYCFFLRFTEVLNIEFSKTTPRLATSAFTARIHMDAPNSVYAFNALIRW